LELRYGLADQRVWTLDEVAQTLGVTRERIRQIENQALRKLQQLDESQALRDAPDVRTSARREGMLRSHRSPAPARADRTGRHPHPFERPLAHIHVA
jgi:hypothetical protein